VALTGLGKREDGNRGRIRARGSKTQNSNEGRWPVQKLELSTSRGNSKPNGARGRPTEKNGKLGTIGGEKNLRGGRKK